MLESFTLSASDQQQQMFTGSHVLVVLEWVTSSRNVTGLHPVNEVRVLSSLSYG